MSGIKLETEKFFSEFMGMHYRSVGDGKKICEFAEAYVEHINKANEDDTSEETALNIDLVSSCYAVFDEEDNIVQLYQTEEKASKGMEEFKRSHEHTEFYVDTMQIN